MSEIRSESVELLDRAEQAHRNGRFALMRKLLVELGRAGPLAPAEQQRVAALRERLRPDPLVALLIAACLILLGAVVSSTWR